MQRGKRQDPKIALNYTKINLIEDSGCEVPDEGPTLPARSLDRMQEAVIPRHSITSNIKTMNTLTPKAGGTQAASPFARENFNAKKKLFMANTIKTPKAQGNLYSRQRGSFLVEDDGEPINIGSKFKAPSRGTVVLKKDYKKVKPKRSKLVSYTIYIQRCW